MASMDHDIPVAAVTSPPEHHYFGYFNVSPWDATDRYMVALACDFNDRPQRPGDVARIGLIDTQQSNAWTTLAETRAWNWQQSCMLQWLGPACDRHILYNDIADGRPVTRVLDVFSGHTRTLPLPTYCVSRDGTQAISVNFGRLHVVRPGYGYVGAPNPSAGVARPADDGLWWMDLTTGEHKLILTLEQLAALAPKPSMRGAMHWAIHMQFNTDDSRFVLLHRWERPVGRVGYFARRVRAKLRLICGRPARPARITRMLTCRPDGTDLRILADDGMVSHFDWMDPHHITGWGTVAGPGDHYTTWDDRDGSTEVVGADVLNCDGHCSFSPDRRWLLTDTYPDPATQKRALVLYRPADNTRFTIGRFYSPPEMWGEIRCDLHPRWNRAGTRVCFDSIHEGPRQVYVADVADLVRLRDGQTPTGEAV